uniref:ICA69 domain-containing protein n=1 Tax=Gongylonema pulchrum TaxID=637853 RepID=A0A183CZB3_9BILA
LEKPNAPGELAEDTSGKASKSDGSTVTTLPSTATPAVDDGNFLESLLQGRLDKVDWLGSLLGTKHMPTPEEGNAIAQILSGGIFGPAS